MQTYTTYTIVVPLIFANNGIRLFVDKLLIESYSMRISPIQVYLRHKICDFGYWFSQIDVDQMGLNLKMENKSQFTTSSNNDSLTSTCTLFGKYSLGEVIW